MRVPVSWLREYVPLEMPLPDLAERLSISTAEVEGIERRGVPDGDVSVRSKRWSSKKKVARCERAGCHGSKASLSKLYSTVSTSRSSRIS